jgi:alkanesulfonate monooxygenase SsuD/methylene tetrahydromethanopterin reductase-like flavin-dependent oxidoreductase (luciferase family)
MSRIVITGGPGAGKTTLLLALQARGYTIVGDSARAIIQDRRRRHLSPRPNAYEETLQIIKALWTQKTATFAGEYYRVTEAYGEPKPDPIPPLMLGAFKPKMLRLTAKYADWWNVSSTGIEGYRRMAEECERACADVGRDGATLRRTWGGGCICASTHGEAEAIAFDLFAILVLLLATAMCALARRLAGSP